MEMEIALLHAAFVRIAAAAAAGAIVASGLNN